MNKNENIVEDNNRNISSVNILSDYNSESPIKNKENTIDKEIKVDNNSKINLEKSKSKSKIAKKEEVNSNLQLGNQNKNDENAPIYITNNNFYISDSNLQFSPSIIPQLKNSQNRIINNNVL